MLSKIRQHRHRLFCLGNIIFQWKVSVPSKAVNFSQKHCGKEFLSNIRVNAVAFGTIDTRMNSCFSAEERTALEEEIPIGRYGTTEEAAECIYCLATAPAYLTGQIITMDGIWCKNILFLSLRIPRCMKSADLPLSTASFFYLYPLASLHFFVLKHSTSLPYCVQMKYYCLIFPKILAPWAHVDSWKIFNNGMMAVP